MPLPWEGLMHLILIHSSLAHFKFLVLSFLYLTDLDLEGLVSNEI